MYDFEHSFVGTYVKFSTTLQKTVACSSETLNMSFVKCFRFQYPSLRAAIALIVSPVYLSRLNRDYLIWDIQQIIICLGCYSKHHLWNLNYCLHWNTEITLWFHQFRTLTSVIILFADNIRISGYIQIIKNDNNYTNKSYTFKHTGK